MRTSRISALALSVFLLTAIVCAQTAEEAPFRVTKLSDRVIVFTEESPMENIIVALATKKGLVVVDSTGSPYTAALLRKVIAKEFGRDDFAYLINTHHHWDHAYGNQVFADLKIVGHEGCVTAMERNKANVPQMAVQMGRRATELQKTLENLDESSKEAKNLKTQMEFNKRNFEGLSKNYVSTPPNITFSDRMTIDLGDMTMKLYYFGRAHSGSDILTHVPEEGLLLTGDLFLERVWLPLFSGQNILDIPRWIEVLNTTLDGEDPVKHVIPAHRDVWKKEKLVLWRDYIVDLWTGVKAASDEGLDLQAVLQKLPLPEKFTYLKDLGHDDATLQRFQQRNVTAFWRQLKESAAMIIGQTIRESGIDAAVKKYHYLKSDKSGDYYFSEEDFNALGYALMGSGRIKEAIEVFKLNVEAYPDSWNVYDSLGEAYMTKGDNELAVLNYQKSIQLNPNNENGKQMLARLQKQQ